MLEIRNARQEDIPVIQELTHRIWPVAYGEILSPAQLEYMLDLMYSTESLEHQVRSHQFMVLYDDEVPLGFASYSKADISGNFRLHKIYVLPDQQGKGLGKFLLDHVMNEIKLNGAVQLELNVNRFNKAKTFYQKLGFVVSREEDIDIGSGYFMNDYVMTKAIK
ncbi:MAG: GNAT family N-acetyltransferase [Chitinophagaceae bacterium]